MEPVILVGIGGAIGSLGRFWFSRYQPVGGIPVGTLIVNIIGSFVFSLLTFSQVPGDWYFLVGVGCTGVFTTFRRSVTRLSV